MSKSQKSNKFIRDWRPTGKQYAEAERGVYESKNVSVLVALALSLLANLLSVVCFIVSGIDFGLLFVGLMLACDVLFLVLFSKVNFCCKYSAGFVALYLVINVLLTAASLLLGLSVIGDGSLFTVFGVILRIASIVVFTLVLLLSVRTARTSKRAVSFSVVLSVLLLGGLVYGQLFYGGYYGQNYSVLNGERAVVYVLRTDDEGEEYYFAKSVLPGLGTSVIVEDTYLGKEVRGVSANVFTAARLKAIALKGDRVMEVGGASDILTNETKLPDITVKKELVNAYRNEAFQEGSAAARNVLSVAYLPELAEDEVAVRFAYDTTELAPELYNAENVLPTLVLKKGESVKLDDFTTLMQNYCTQENVLEWSYENAYRWNLLDMQVNGEDVFSAAINKNTNVKVDFEPVKKIEYTLMDAEYYVPTNFDEIGYISPSAEEVETDYDHREGCYVTMTGNMGVEFSDVDSLRAHAFSSAVDGMDTVHASVYYRMKTPSISQFFASAENRQQADTFTYGDELKLEFAVEEHGAIITYTLQEDDGNDGWVTLHENSEVASYLAGVRTPGMQYYNLVARANDVYGNPNLFAESEHTLQFDVEKKTISGVWDLSQLPAEFDSLAHQASYSIDAAQAVTEHGASVPDSLTFSTTETAVKEAGSYTFTATLDDELLEKYVLTDHTATHTVARKVVDVAWDKTEYTYDGNSHVPNASWTLADGSPVSKAGSNEQTNANVNGGQYTTTVEIGDSNHIFASGETTSTKYTINSKTLEMTDSDWTNTSFVYNNTKRTPTATVATGVAVDGTLTLDVSGGQTNAGSYTATASTTNTNYTLTGVTTRTFIIDKATAMVTWSNLSLVYNGNAQLPTASYATFTTSGAQTGMATAKVAATAESINVDTYTANATHATALDEQNYTLTNTTNSFDITKKSVSATWGTSSFTYNGTAQVPTASYKNVKNQTVSLTVSGAQTNAGDYTANAALETSLEQQNYALENTSCDYTIGKASVAAVWSTASFTFDGTQKALTATYTGFEGTQSLTVSGGAGTDASSYPATAALTSALEQQNYTLTNTSKTLVINKKSVAVVWSNLSLVYNASEQKPIAIFTDVFGAEQPLSVNKGLTDVGSTTVTASGTDTNYAYTSTTATFAITAYTIDTIEWIGETTYTYTGEVQGLTARYENLAGGYTTAYTTDKMNAGTYTATAQTNDKNYQFASTAQKTKQFTINAAEIAVSWSNTSFTYNGKTQAPTASATGVKGEAVTVTVSGGQTNAGTHTATATTTNTNYKLTNNTCQFTIEKQTVTVASWSNLTQEYTGAALKPTAICSQSSVTLTVSGSLTNAGSTTVTAALSTADAKNYELTGETTASFTVTAKKINVTWSGASFTYDGTAKAPTATYAGVTITVSVAAKSGSSLTGGKAVNAGTYTATATTSNQNYEIVNSTYDFTIVAAVAEN